MTLPLVVPASIHKMGILGWCVMRWVGKKRDEGICACSLPSEIEQLLRNETASPGLSNSKVDDISRAVSCRRDESPMNGVAQVLCIKHTLYLITL